MTTPFMIVSLHQGKLFETGQQAYEEAARQHAAVERFFAQLAMTLRWLALAAAIKPLDRKSDPSNVLDCELRVLDRV